MSDQQKILPGSPVTLHLSIRLEDGTEAVSTFAEEPVTLTMGDGTLQPGLELALYGLCPGATQTLKLLPDQAYGPRDPALIQFMPMTDFDGSVTPKIGQIVAFAMPDGDEIPGTIRSVDEGRIEVDFNHPLAGHEITFEVEILRVSAPQPGSDRDS